MNGETFGWVFAGFGSLFAVGGVAMAISQARKLRTYLPVPATVVSSEVIKKSDNDGGWNYTPRITYVYHTGGQAYESEKAQLFEQSASSSSEADRIVDRFPPGLMTQAFVHPTKHRKSFLIKELSLSPYVLAMFSMVFVCVGVTIAMAGGRNERQWTYADVALIVFVLWNTVGLFSMVHFRWSGGRIGWEPAILFVLYFGVGIFLLMVWHESPDLPIPPPSNSPTNVEESDAVD